MKRVSLPRSIWTDPVYFLAFGLGSGLAPWMPGTFGTIMAIPFFWLLQLLPWQLYLAVTLIAFVVGIWLCDKAEKAVGVPDYSGIVWDEMVGYWAAMFLVPATWSYVLLGFLIFRFFDIIKPWPINWFNKHVHNGFGIMLDDLLAAIATCVILHIVMLVATAFN